MSRGKNVKERKAFTRMKEFVESLDIFGLKTTKADWVMIENRKGKWMTKRISGSEPRGLYIGSKADCMEYICNTDAVCLGKIDIYERPNVDLFV